MAENLEFGKKYAIENIENKKLIKELDEYKKNYNEMKLRLSNIELEYDTLKKKEQNFNKLLEKFDFIQSEKNQALKKVELASKIINDLKLKLNNSIEELNILNKENDYLKKKMNY